MVRHDYFCPQCGYMPKREEMGINVQDVGITTVDGRTTNNPVYAVAGGDTGISNGIISSGPSRSKRNKKLLLPLSTDDKLLQKQGYTILQTAEYVGQPSKTLQPNSSQVRPENYDILDKYNKREKGVGIHGL